MWMGTALYALKKASSVLVACTRTFFPATSATLVTGNLEYMLRKPWVKRPRERAPCTLSAIMALKASLMALSFMARSRCTSSQDEVQREDPGLRGHARGVGSGV